MGLLSKVIAFVIVLSFLTLSVSSFSQSATSPQDDIQLGSVSFKKNSTKLSKKMKEVLDTMISHMQSNATMQVRAISSNKDLCPKCSKRSWKRTQAVLQYLSKHGVSEQRLVFTNRLDGESNKVDLFLTTSVGESVHPNFNKQQ